jgi:CMP-N-acetylneuraminic acid synthetase
VQVKNINEINDLPIHAHPIDAALQQDGFPSVKQQRCA